ncbi:MAG: rRNA pseudouridine synthase [Lachnospiraceae bacterium]|nr:rRNA pseudouridine synthase [Lachnospiraceae bacterium]
MIRVDKYLTDCGTGTRSEVKKLIQKGRISINGTVIKDPGTKIDLDKDIVCNNNEPVVYEQFRYFMLNKPMGCVSATKDNLSATVLDILKNENTKGLFPVGRLDKDTEGLLLITNDGMLAHNLLSPKKHVEKLYYVEADKKLSDENMTEMENGVDIGDEKLTLPSKIEFVGDSQNKYCYNLSIKEGRFHQVKRMFEAFGSNVTYLKRLNMGSLILDDDLLPGEYRKLSEEEIKRLYAK